MVYDAPAEFKRGDRTQMMRGIASIMLSSLMIYGVSHGGWDWPDDDEEQWQAWIEATLGSTIASIPVAGGLAMSGIKGFDMNILTAQSKIDDFRWKAKQFQNGQYAEAAFDIMIDIAVLTGRKIPYGATRRTIKGIKDLNEGSTLDARRLIWSSSALYE